MSANEPKKLWPDTCRIQQENANKELFYSRRRSAELPPDTQIQISAQIDGEGPGLARGNSLITAVILDNFSCFADILELQDMECFIVGE